MREREAADGHRLPNRRPPAGKANTISVSLHGICVCQEARVVWSGDVRRADVVDGSGWLALAHGEWQV